MKNRQRAIERQRERVRERSEERRVGKEWRGKEKKSKVKYQMAKFLTRKKVRIKYKNNAQ